MRPRGVWDRSGSSGGGVIPGALVEGTCWPSAGMAQATRQLMCAIGLESLGRAVLAEVGASRLPA